MFRNSFSRRSFLKKSSLGTLAGVLAAGERIPVAEAVFSDRVTTDDPITCAVIGFGSWGREIAAVISEIEEMELTAICDQFPLMLRRAERSHPGARREEDYRSLLQDESIQAVFVATPTHLHREIVLAALAAGKNVYCEAPIAHTMEDARAIAKAAREVSGQIFQAGLLYRTEPQYRSVYGFVRSGALGRFAMTRSQWHYKDSWRRSSSSAARARELNWRLDEEVSLGLVGEVGIQQIDTTVWMLGALPTAVSGFGGVTFWRDGRTVPDTVQSILEFPRGEHMIFDATLVSGFDAAYDLLFGSDSTIILRDNKAWMFKEVDAPQLGWEVYARKDRFYKETGIALLANATKIEALGQDPTADDPNAKSPLWHALKAFADNHNYGPFEPVVNAQLAYEATVIAIKANEAVKTSSRIEFDPDWFSIDA